MHRWIVPSKKGGVQIVKLVANFTSNGGSSQTLTLADPNRSYTPAQLKGLLEQIGPLDLFSKDGNTLYDTVESAMFVETKETILF
nr:DUF2922 domain-containing protein [Enterococcus sp. MJM16]